ncbi:MFS transporter, partial [Micromonospora zamorensis]
AVVPTAVAIGLLLAATVIYTVGDLWHAGAGAALAYDLAAPDALGAYQGVDGLLAGLVRAAGPALLTWLIIDGGPVGWLALAGLLALTGLAVPPLTRRALADRADRADRTERADRSPHPV